MCVRVFLLLPSSACPQLLCELVYVTLLGQQQVQLTLSLAQQNVCETRLVVVVGLLVAWAWSLLLSPRLVAQRRKGGAASNLITQLLCPLPFAVAKPILIARKCRQQFFFSCHCQLQLNASHCSGVLAGLLFMACYSHRENLM